MKREILVSAIAGALMLAAWPTVAAPNPERDAYFWRDAPAHQLVSGRLGHGQPPHRPGRCLQVRAGRDHQAPHGLRHQDRHHPLDFMGVTDHSEYVGVTQEAEHSGVLREHAARGAADDHEGPERARRSRIGSSRICSRWPQKRRSRHSWTRR